MTRNIFEELSKRLDNANLTKEEKLKIIEQACEDYRKQVDTELNMYFAKQLGGAVLEIGSAALPMAGVAKVGATIGKNFLTKHLGRKISENIGSWVLSGAVSGGVFGLGEGLKKDLNPILTSIEGITGGALTGGTLGAVGVNIQRAVRGKQLRDFGDIDILSPQARKNFTYASKNFYKDYIQDIQIKKGDSMFDFTKRGMQEQSRWNPKQAQNYSELVKDIENATRLPDVPNLKPGQKPNVDHYELYQGENGLHHVEVMKNGEKRFYITKDTPRSTTRTTNPDAPRSPNDIITDDVEKLNPTQVAIPENIQSDMEFEPFQGYIQKSDFDAIPPANPFENSNNGQPTGYAAPVESPTKIFTPEEIGKMSPTEFAQNEGAIMEQLRAGQIGKEVQKTDYSQYKNPESGKGRVFTREDLDKMTTGEYTKHESEIMAQLNSIGIPSKTEVSRGTTTYSSEKSRQSSSGKDGKWVTINGNHVFIEK